MIKHTDISLTDEQRCIIWCALGSYVWSKYELHNIDYDKLYFDNLRDKFVSAEEINGCFYHFINQYI